MLAPAYAPTADQEESVPLAHIPQVETTWAYWDTDYGVQNEWGLSIGESTSTGNTVGWPAEADKPYGYNKVGIEDLSKIALERCRTARCAVKTMGAIAVEHGFYSGDSGDPSKPGFGASAEALAIADAEPGDLWIFNVLTGKGNRSAIWAAQRVPPDHVVAIGNSFTIRKLNLSDSDNNLYSPGVKNYAKEMGWWTKDEETDGPEIFDFFSAYGYHPVAGRYSWEPVFQDRILSYYSGRRMWRIFSLLSPEEGAKLDPNLGNLPKTPDPYPPSVPAPVGSVTLQMVMNSMRDHYEGTPYDLTQGMAAGPWGNPNRARTAKGVQGQWERAIAMYRSGWSFILEARPHQLSRTWFGYDSAHSTVYLPFYGAADRPAPTSFSNDDLRMSVFSFDAAYWAFSLVNQYCDRNFRVINGDVRKQIAIVEGRAISQAIIWEQEAYHLTKLGHQEQALALLSEKSNDFASRAVEDWWQYAWHLIAKYGREIVTFNESETGGTGPQFWVLPSWWLRSPEVGFSAWSPEGPFHGINLTENETEAAFECLNRSKTVVSILESSSLLSMAENRQMGINWMMTTGSAAAAVATYLLGMHHGRRQLEQEYKAADVDAHYIRHVC